MSYYKIQKLGAKMPSSMTEPSRGSLEVVVKQDSDNSPCCVYNEMVSLRLAQRLGIPLAMGVPAIGDGGVYFASLVVGGLSVSLPNVTAKRMAAVAKRYPVESAALFVFDVWTLNDDRLENVKANLTPAAIHMVAGIDHEQSLLGARGDIQASLDALEAGEIPREHPLEPYVRGTDVNRWVAEIGAAPDDWIDAAAILGHSVNGVHDRSQKKLASVLKSRRDRLSELVGQART